MNLISTLIFLLVQFYVCYASTTDPCDSYIAINDTRMTVAYKASSNKDVTCQNLPPLKWYRYTGTRTGLMTRACPQDLQCGSLNQIWFNDTLPSVSDGEIDKQICLHQGPMCCARTIQIKTKNCTEFIIYHHIPSQACTNYCYEAPGNDLTATTTKMDSSTSNPGKSLAGDLTATTNKIDSSTCKNNSPTHNNSQATAIFPTIWMLVVFGCGRHVAQFCS